MGTAESAPASETFSPYPTLIWIHNFFLDLFRLTRIADHQVAPAKVPRRLKRAPE